MTDSERISELQLLGIAPDTQVCANCKHFCQHYNKNGKIFFCGHCTYPRVKDRRVIDTCKYFEAESPVNDLAAEILDLFYKLNPVQQKVAILSAVLSAAANQDNKEDNE